MGPRAAEILFCSRMQPNGPARRGDDVVLLKIIFFNYIYIITYPQLTDPLLPHSIQHLLNMSATPTLTPNNPSINSPVPVVPVKPVKHVTLGDVIGIILLVVIIIIVVTVIVMIILNSTNSVVVQPIDLSKQYYIISTDDLNNTGSLFPTYLNMSKTGFYAGAYPSTMWSFVPVGNGTTTITDNRGVTLRSSNGFISDGSTDTPPSTSPVLTVASTGVAFNVSPYKDTDPSAMAGSTNMSYKLTTDINILNIENGIPQLVNINSLNEKNLQWWKFAPAAPKPISDVVSWFGNL